jgi:broad-specificity NMP kinase
MNILIVGNCGVGKTWVMKQFLTNNDKFFKLGKINFHENKIIIIGKYDGTIFEGSDKLSMSAITDVEKIINYAKGKLVLWEGDRFMNKTFIEKVKPIILKIKGNGIKGRINRGSQQTERQIKSIETRVSNIKHNYIFENSNDCLNFIKKLYEKGRFN